MALCTLLIECSDLVAEDAAHRFVPPSFVPPSFHSQCALLQDLACCSIALALALKCVVLRLRARLCVQPESGAFKGESHALVT
jgi:hypothetical protein